MDKLITFWKWLEGKKTFLLALATIAYALSGFVTGHLPQDEAINLALGALGLASLRHGMTSGK